jgi:hypothetical protein
MTRGSSSGNETIRPGKKKSPAEPGFDEYLFYSVGGSVRSVVRPINLLRGSVRASNR